MKQSLSQEAANFLLDDFQQKIDSSIRDYEKITTTPYRYLPGIKAYHGKGKPRRVKKDSTKKMERQIKNVLSQPEVREGISLALQRITDDVFEVSKAVTPVLLTLISTGNLNIEPTPLLFAGIALAITRMGISVFRSEKQTSIKNVSPQKTAKNKKSKR